MKTMDPMKLSTEGYLQEVNRRFFHPLGLALAVTISEDSSSALSVLDARDDPEGFRFEKEGGELAPKAAMVDAEFAARSPARLAALGYVFQPAGG